MTARALVIGAGSIGIRHRDVLESIGLAVASVSRRGNGTFRTLAEALAGGHPDYVVIANETAAHQAGLEQLHAAGFAGTVLVEKPVFPHVMPAPHYGFGALLVGYNLRFHSIIMALRDLLADEKVLAVRAEVGQHLDSWRPGRDYRQSYSASRAAGGGVLRDLSHELDYVTWLFGSATSVTAQVLSTGSLDIESEDICALLMACQRCPSVAVSLDYLRRPPSRTLTVITARHSFRADLLAQTLTRDGDPVAVPPPGDRNMTYQAMHRAALAGGRAVCSFAEGLKTVALIEAAERASQTLTWVTP
ncbi:MAG: Gfo/Idh/MocA family protein [Devosia sp.]